MLIFPRDENVIFDTTDVRRRLNDLPGVKATRKIGDEYVDFEWVAESDGEQVFCSLQTGGRAINIDPESAAAVKFAFELARRFEFPVDLANDEYTYHLELSSFDSAESAWDSVTAAHREAMDGPQPFRG